MKKLFTILALAVLAIPNTFAQPTIDGSISDWTGATPATDNSSAVRVGTAGGLNEWIFKDTAMDNRTDNFGGFVDGTKQDIQEIRIASNNSNLYFAAKFPANVDKITGDGALQLQISIRRTGSMATTTYLGSNGNTKVPVSAQWDYLIITKGGSNSTNNQVWTTNFGGSTDVGSYASDATNGVLEGSVPWTTLGGAPVGTDTFIMTFTLYRANTSNGAFSTGSGTKGHCLDYTTTATGNTFATLIGEDFKVSAANDTGRLDAGGAMSVSFDPANGVLPITLTALTNQVNGNDAAINWTVATENNITHYEVEQNVNNTWKVVANVAAANLGAYTASIKGLNAGLHNFRLVAVEKDGSRNVYGNTTVLVEVPGSHVVNSAYPNPFAASATVEFAVAKAQSVTVEVYNTLGQKVATVFEGAVDANNTKAVRISAEGLHNGTYFVRISGETFSETQRISVVK